MTIVVFRTTPEQDAKLAEMVGVPVEDLTPEVLLDHFRKLRREVDEAVLLDDVDQIMRESFWALYREYRDDP